MREAVNIPVLANGNIRNLQDVHDCIAYTGAEGVMSAESLLEDPALFWPKRLQSGGKHNGSHTSRPAFIDYTFTGIVMGILCSGRVLHALGFLMVDNSIILTQSSWLTVCLGLQRCAICR